MTVEELKVEAADLSPDDRDKSADSNAQSVELHTLRREALVREIEVGLDQLDRGDFVECWDNEELQRFFADVKARGHEAVEVSRRLRV